MLHDSCFYASICTGVVLVFAWPLYIYLITQWYAHRNHFVIRNRWPTISFMVVLCTIIVQILFFIESAFCISNLNPVSQGTSNVIQGLVYYRAYLLHAQTMKTRHLKQIMAPVIATKQNEENKGCQPWHQNVSRLILCIIVTASTVVPICRYLDIKPPVYVVFVVTLLFGIVCLINIIRAKVKDSIGITKECIVQIMITLATIVTVSVTTSLFPSWNYEINTVLGLLLNTSYGLTTLCIAYNLIRRASVSTDTDSAPIREASSSPDPSREASSSVPLPDFHRCSGLNISKHAAPEPGNAPILVLHTLQDSKSLSEWLDKPLWLFLKDNTEHFSLFVGYLCECFALENMLFLERAIILHHLIRKYQHMDSAAVQVINTTDDARIKSALARTYYRLQFVHLTPIYNDIDAIINNGCDHNEAHDSMMYKRGICTAMKLIYRQFCCGDSDTEINIGFDIRTRLCALFEGKTDNEILEQFTHYEDLLMVYHDAVDQVMILCECIYRFQFKSYCERNAAKDSTQKAKMGNIMEQTIAKNVDVNASHDV